jgi:hypothetical protein
LCICLQRKTKMNKNQASEALLEKNEKDYGYIKIAVKYPNENVVTYHVVADSPESVIDANNNLSFGNTIGGYFTTNPRWNGCERLSLVKATTRGRNCPLATIENQ